jgi:hypothetical protein
LGVIIAFPLDKAHDLWLYLNIIFGYAIAQALRHWLLIAEAHIQSQDSPCKVCGGQSSTVVVIIPPLFHIHL